MERNWTQIDPEAALERLGSRAQGLDDDEVRRHRQEYGPNELAEQEGRGPWRILWEQIREPMVLLLIVAAGVSIFIHEYLDAGAIGVIIVLNAILGFVQDFRAEKAMAALRQMAVPEVVVRRSGVEVSVNANELTPGDVVLLQAGSRVPADCRVLKSHRLQTQEAALTGESHAIAKSPGALEEDNPPIGDRHNMVFMGTHVSSGRGEAVVTEIGMQTELGKIAGLIQGAETQRTPLQRRLDKMGVWLGVAALGIIAVVIALGLLRGQDLTLMLMTALSMAVAAVPEGLPAVASIALALGARRMLRRKALIRKLPAVETLGSVTVICSDKTGTLTENRMRLSVLRLGGFELDVQRQFADAGAVGDEPDERFRILDEQPAAALALLVGALCNDARLKVEPDADETADGDKPEFATEGDPTEGAFLTAAARFGSLKPTLDAIFPRDAEVPFDAHRKRMTTVHQAPRDGDSLDGLAARAMKCAARIGSGSHVALLKGAVDTVLDACSGVWIDGELQPLEVGRRVALLQANDELAGAGKRVLGLAFRWLDGAPADDSAEAVERDFIFLGMAGLIDPPRREALEAVERCKSAGIRPIMITGDHPLTAQQIASEVGVSGDGRAMTGRQLDETTDEELKRVVQSVSVYARVAPEHKLRIVEALQQQGHIVAMTGDGVNDAPALKTADIGVAMGITGADVSKDASETVLLDDNFATIVNSVEEGRTIYDNIRKFLKYTMTSNTGEICVMLFAPLLGMPLPLVPLQILWINLVTDGLPGLAMAVEPAERDIMRRPPRDPREPIFDRDMVRHLFTFGVLMGCVSLGAGFWFWSENPTTDYNASWGTIVFTVVTLSQMGHALAVRTSRDSLFRVGVFSNLAMLGSVTLTLGLQLAVIYVPSLQRLFRTTALSLPDLLLCLLFSTVVFWGVEGEKWWKRRASA